MQIFDNYSTSIRNILNPSSADRPFSSGGQEPIGRYLNKGYDSRVTEALTAKKSKGELARFEANNLVNFFGENPFAFPAPTIGDHPDFKGLDKGQEIHHFCTSFFLDIKGSTKLATKYDLSTVRQVKDTLLSLAIGVVNFFGGHIQRLQGDALFAQFARRDKGQHINDSIIGALNAASVLCNYLESDLADIFEQAGIEPLKIRIGIDVGEKEKVLWSRYGLDICGELTTTSLHTDLAAKLQHQASNNGILVGKNIKELLDLELKDTDGFLQYLLKPDGSKDYYIFNYNGYSYNKYIFDWKKYLLLHPLLKKQSDGKRLEVDNPNLKIKCFIAPPDSETWEEYFPNAYCIPKKHKIKYVIYHSANEMPYHCGHQTVEWRAFNSGKEATDQGEREHDFGGGYQSRHCETNAGYLGHHYVQCKVYQKGDKGRPKQQIAKLTFPIFVQ
jgi:adenylate cyclase